MSTYKLRRDSDEPWHLAFYRAMLTDALQTLRAAPICVDGRKVYESQDYRHTYKWVVEPAECYLSAASACDALGYDLARLRREAGRIHKIRRRIYYALRRALDGRDMPIHVDIRVKESIAALEAGGNVDGAEIIERWFTIARRRQERRAEHDAARYGVDRRAEAAERNRQLYALRATLETGDTQGVSRL